MTWQAAVGNCEGRGNHEPPAALGADCDLKGRGAAECHAQGDLAWARGIKSRKGWGTITLTTLGTGRPIAR